MRYLVLRLQGPLQAWATDSQYNVRATGTMPTKSGIAGLCCAALGHARGSEGEKEFLRIFNALRLMTIALPRRVGDRLLHRQRLVDYHTVLDTRTAEGKIKPSHITRRHYLLDAAFGAIIEGPSAMLVTIGDALRNPVWGVWLGRKSCIPTTPVYAGIVETREEALTLLLGEDALSSLSWQDDAPEFQQGVSALPDLAHTFDSQHRRYSQRRITRSSISGAEP